MRKWRRGYLTTLVTPTSKILLTLFALVGCSGGSTAYYSLQISVSGLDSGDSIHYTYNGMPATVSTNGFFQLASLPVGENYTVRITQQPFQKVCRLNGDYFVVNESMPNIGQTVSVKCVPHSNLNDTGLNENLTVDSFY